MKKQLMILLALVCFGIGTAYADGTKTCKVNGTNGSVEVSVYDGDKEKGTASISFANDTDDDVNVRYEISFRGQGNYGIVEVARKSGSKRVPPHSETTIQVSINRSYTSATVESVTGEKCVK